MKRSAIILFALTLLVSISGCKKDDTDPGIQHVSSSDDMLVPEGFDFNTTSEISFKVNTNTIWGKEKIRVDIYDMPPSAGGELLFSGFADGFGEVSGKLKLASGLSRVFVELKTPDGNSEQLEVDIKGTSFNCQFSNPKSKRKSAMPVSPACDAGCVLSLPAQSGNSVIKTTDKAGVYCFSGSITGTITAHHPQSVVRLCGNADLQSLILNDGASLEIAEGAVVKITDLQLNSTKGEIKVYNAELEVGGNFNPEGNVINYGKVLVSGAVSVKGLASIRNYGEFTIDNDLELYYQVHNYHQMHINGDLDIRSSGELSNHCRVGVSGDLISEGTLLMNSGYIGTTGDMNFSQNANVELSAASMLRSSNFYLNGAISGKNGKSLIKVNQQTSLSSTAVLSGSVDLCDLDGVEVMNGQLTGGAGLYCGTFIPRSACNPEGNGQSNYVDTDNDGVKDLLDRYPTEPSVCGIVSYPSGGAYATLAFEDLWPAKGDYDFNDLVVRYQHHLVINAENLVTRIETQLYISAVGSGYNKGFGFQFKIAPGDVASVSGQRFSKQLLNIASNGTEMGQSKAVIMAFDDVFDLIINKPSGPFINTTSDAVHAESDTIRMVVTLATPKSLTELGEFPFNPFIYIRDDRGKELHLLDEKPTDLMNSSYLGSKADRSDPAAGKYFVTETNQPWVLNVVGEFAHPLEKTDILDGYEYFDIWAQSGGVSREDWHVNHAGYRDDRYVYTK